MSDLPAGWTETTIGEVVEKKVPQHTPLENEDFYYIDISSVDRTAKKIINPQKLTGKDAPSRARQVVAKGDVLVSMTRPNLNAVAIVSDDLDGQIASTGFDVLRAKDVESRWLYYLVRTNDFVTAMTDLVQGALYPAVRPRDIRDYEIPLAPLPEQKRIAEKLDQVLARVDSCQTRLERVPQILKRFRQSVLAAATSGQLTEGWRNENIEEPKNDELDYNDLPYRWQWVTVGDLTNDIQYGFTESAVENPVGPKFLRITDIQDGKVNWDNVPYCKMTDSEKKKYLLKSGDIVFARTGATTGKSFLIQDCPESVFASYLIRLRMPNTINVKYFAYFLDSPAYWSQIMTVRKGSAQPGVNATILATLNTPLPPIDEQTEIVRRVEKLFAYAAKLEARYQSASEQVARLTPSLLAKAFRGELVGQDPNDESASALAGRIRETRDAQKADPSVKSKKSKRS